MELRAPPSPSTNPKNPTALISIGVFQILILAALAWLILSPKDQWTPQSSENSRKVASKLLAAGAIDEAASLYTQYLSTSPTPATQGQIAYSLGELYLKSGQYQKALRWLYEAQSANPPTLSAEISKKIVHTLERLGRTHAAKAALAASVKLNPADSLKRSQNDPVVATIGKREISESEIQRALDELPPELSKQYSKNDGKTQFLKKYVADELLWQKAQKLEYDRDPQIQSQMGNILRHLVVSKFVEKELTQKLQIEADDVKNFFDANKDRFKRGEEEPVFEKVKPQVEQAYKMNKFQIAYGKMMESELKTADVQLYPERMRN